MASKTTVVVSHATDAGNLQISLSKWATMFEVKQAIVTKLGWGNVSQIRILMPGGGATASFKDDELLRNKRRLTITGVCLSADVEATSFSCNASPDVSFQRKELSELPRTTGRLHLESKKRAELDRSEPTTRGAKKLTAAESDAVADHAESLPSQSQVIPVPKDLPADTELDSSQDRLTTKTVALRAPSEQRLLRNPEANLCVLVGPGNIIQESLDLAEDLQTLAKAEWNYLWPNAEADNRGLTQGAAQQESLSDNLVAAFWHAVKEQSTKDVVPLLLQRASVNMIDDKGATPLLIAVQNHNVAMCCLLLAFSADPDLKTSKNFSARATVAQRPKSTLARILEQGPLAARQQIIREATVTASLDVIEALIAASCDLSASDSEGRTALHSCVTGLEYPPVNIHPDRYSLIMRKLLDARASVNSRDELGETPLMLAVRQAVGKDAWSTDATTSRQVMVLLKMCRLLISRQADVNLANTRSGETPLISAAAAGSCQIAKLLLESDADAFHKSSCGQTAFSAARTDDKVLQMLLDMTEDPDWSEFDCQLYRGTRGKFNPDNEKQQPLPSRVCASCKVSVICPTIPSRSRFHRQLYDCFQSQTYPDKELIVIETGAEPSKIFSSPPISADTRVIYRFYKEFGGIDRVSIGIKRNLAIRLASGPLIAQFDDDDFYSPIYLERMVDILLRHSAHLLKLSSWYILNLDEGMVGYCDPQSQRGIDDGQWVDEQVFGYGFSYIFQRDVAIADPFPDLFMGEDYVFLTSLQEFGYSVCIWPDLEGICLRLQHGKNTSMSWAHDYLPPTLIHCMQVAEIPRLKQLLSRSMRVTVPGAGVSHSDVAALAIAVLKFNEEARATGDSIEDACPVDVRILEHRDFCGSELLKQAFQRLQRRRSKLILTNYAQQKQKMEFQVPCTSTLLEIKERAANRLGVAFHGQVSLRDVEQPLADEQLLLSRASLFYTVTYQASNAECLD